MHTYRHHFDRCRTARSAAAALLVAVVASAYAADAYPTRPITLVVPFPAGGTTDVVARAVADSMSRRLGQAVVIANRVGAAGTVGATQVARATPDGYTLLMGGPADQVTAPFMLAKPPYDAARDFDPVQCVMKAPNVLVVNQNVAAKTPAELVKLAKAEPGKLNFASAGNGNTSHLLGVLFAQDTGTQLTHVPYRGNAPAVTDTIGGQVQMMFSNEVAVLPHIKSGALRPIAVTADKRLPSLPNVPTLRESGIPIENYSWACLMAPAKTPAEIVDKLRAAVTASLDDPGVVSTMHSAGGEKFALTRDEARRFLASERTTWGTLIREHRIVSD